MGAEKLPTADQERNAARLQLAALAVTLTAWLRHLALNGDLKLTEPKTLRFRLLAAPARIVQHARYLIVKIPDAGPGLRISSSLGSAPEHYAPTDPRKPGPHDHEGPARPEWNRQPPGHPGCPARPTPAQQPFHDQQPARISPPDAT